MKSIKKILLVSFAMLFCNMINADEHPITYFRDYGIKYCKTVEEYQKNYLGKVVKYLPYEGTGSWHDLKCFLNKGGKFNTEYVISKISGNVNVIKFELKERIGGKKVVLKVKHAYSSYNPLSSDFYYTYSFPLFFSADFEKDKSKFIGKSLNENYKNNVQFEIIDMVLRNEKKSYPVIYYVLKDMERNDTVHFSSRNMRYVDVLGKIYRNSNYKCTYTMMNVFDSTSFFFSSKNDYKLTFYTVRNSIDGKIKKVEAAYADKKAFEGDDSGCFLASFLKVEKPANPSIRYGEMTVINENDTTKYNYTDEFIDIIMIPSMDGFGFSLKNVSNNTLKVVWDEAVFVDVDGTTSKVMHYGVKYADRENSQIPSIVIKGSKIKDIAIPTKIVYYSDVSKSWETYSMFKNADKKRNNQTVKLMLPIQVKDVINEYIFEFGIKYEFYHKEYIAD